MRAGERRQGTSLIEMLVTIVVFVVGILAVIQVFPGGIRILAQQRDRLIAMQLLKSQIAEEQGRSDGTPSQILPVAYTPQSGGVVQITADPTRTPDDLGAQPSAVSANGVVSVSGSPVGYWPLVSGANVYREIVREGHVIPTPRVIGNSAAYGSSGVLYGGLLLLNYGPILSSTDLALKHALSLDGISSAVTLQPIFPISQSAASNVVVESNDMVQQSGLPGSTTPQSYVYYAGSGVDNNNAYLETLYVEAPTVSGATNEYDVRFSADFMVGTKIQRRDIEYTMEANANTAGGYFEDLISTDAASSADPPDAAFLAAVPDHATAALVNIDPATIRVDRIFRKVAIGTAFDAADPYEYSIPLINGVMPAETSSLGLILFSPYSSNLYEDLPSGRTPLRAQVTYDVYDWRIIRHDFRAPDVGTSSTLNYSFPYRSLRAPNSILPDRSIYEGLNVPTDVDPNGAETFLLIDAETGGIYLPSDPTSHVANYTVDYTRGILTFPSAEMEIQYPGSASVQMVNVAGRPLRAMFMLNGDWAAQVQKASADYDETYSALPGAGQFYIGDGLLAGSGTRIYFPRADLGQVVRFDEIDYLTTGGPKTLRGQSMQITSANNDADGPFVDVKSLDSTATHLDTSDGYGGVMGVHGASLSMRAVWEDNGVLMLGTNPSTNVGLLDTYRESYHSMRQATSFLGGQTEP